MKHLLVLAATLTMVAGCGTSAPMISNVSLGAAPRQGVTITAQTGDFSVKAKVDVVAQPIGAGTNKIKVLKVVRELTGLGLKEAKELVDTLSIDAIAQLIGVQPIAAQPISALDPVAAQPISALDPVAAQPISALDPVADQPISALEPVADQPAVMYCPIGSVWVTALQACAPVADQPASGSAKALDNLPEKASENAASALTKVTQCQALREQQKQEELELLLQDQEPHLWLLRRQHLSQLRAAGCLGTN